MERSTFIWFDNLLYVSTKYYQLIHKSYGNPDTWGIMMESATFLKTLIHLHWSNVTIGYFLGRNVWYVIFPFQILFEGHHYWQTKTDVAIDDLSFDCAEPPRRRCPRTQFMCKKTKQCVDMFDMCDGDRNCCDGSDEDPNTACKNYSK